MFTQVTQVMDKLQSVLPKSEPLRSVSTTAVIGASLFAAAKIGFGIKSAITSASRASAAKKRMAAQKKDIVYLIGFPKTKEGIQLSTPCDRVEMYLQLNKIPYEYIPTMDTEISDTGRLPCIELNGVQYNDSKFIIDELERQFGSKTATTSVEDQSTTTSLLALVEHMRWHHYREVMIDHPDFTIDLYTSLLGYPRFMVSNFVMSNRKKMINTWNNAGHGDLSDEQYNLQFVEDLKALEFLISKNKKDSKFILAGGKMTKVDCLIAPWVKTFLRTESLASKVPAYAFACKSEVFKNYVEAVDAALKA